MAVINNRLTEFLKMEESALASRLQQTFGDPLATLCSSVWLIRKEGRELAEMDG